MNPYRRKITRAPDFYIKFRGYHDAKKRLVSIEENWPCSPYITRLHKKFAVICKRLEFNLIKTRHPVELVIAEIEEKIKMINVLSKADNPNGARAAAEMTALNTQLVQLRTTLLQLEEKKFAEQQIYEAKLNHICATYNLGVMVVIKQAASNKEEHAK